MAERTRGYAHRIDVNAPAELVWRGLVEQQLLSSWCGPGARVSARAGGNYYVRINGDLEREAHIEGLTERVTEFLENETKGKPAAQQLQEGD